MNEFVFKEVKFDDFEEDEYGTWSQICQSCVDKYNIDEHCLDIESGRGICGVEGCENESDHYIDFPEIKE